MKTTLALPKIDYRENLFLALVHPEQEGFLFISFSTNSWRGVVEYNAQTYEADLHDLLAEGWEVPEKAIIYENKSSFTNGRLYESSSK